MTITIHNLKNESPTLHDTDFICDNRSPVGNPYMIGKDGTAEDVKAAYVKFANTCKNPAFTSFIDALLYVLKTEGKLRLFGMDTEDGGQLATLKAVLTRRMEELVNHADNT